MTTLVLLPGMDGTGELFAPLLNQLGHDLRIQVIDYPTKDFLEYSALTELVMQQLPKDEDFVLLAESFSGPIGIAIAALNPPRLKGLILCASFAKNPQTKLAILSSLVPVVPLKLAPAFLLQTFLLGRFKNPALNQLLQSAMRKTSTPVMQKRMQAVLSVDYSNKLKHITVPVLYLRAKHDHLVSSQACAILKNALPALKCREFDAPHFLLQVRPQEAAFAISDFLDHCVVSPA